jgi:hypothetical protein
MPRCPAKGSNGFLSPAREQNKVIGNGGDKSIYNIWNTTRLPDWVRQGILSEKEIDILAEIQKSLSA